MMQETADDGGSSTACALVLAATYRRDVAASLRRVWENVHDWEHLPWLHASTFASVAPLAPGPRGWRVKLVAQPGDPARAQVVELDADPARNRYRVVTLDGPGRGSEIRVRLVPRTANETGVVVEFHVPAAPAAKLARIGARYIELYRRLWDEDEAMMIAREAACARIAATAAIGDMPADASTGPGNDAARVAVALDLGTLTEVRARLPFVIELAGTPFRVVDVAGEILAHATTCPHWFGPLDAVPVHDGCVTCPWHGFRFDVRTGASADGRELTLAPAPRVTITHGHVVLHREVVRPTRHP
ncbi:SRPBCC family protein [Candidatus Binatia bacterium]|jgi:nitrite reductase/ring-hydroxylating ferredoxin subunit|nr:SRPBCC family protein [Candidatus Binatia bacterium]